MFCLVLPSRHQDMHLIGCSRAAISMSGVAPMRLQEVLEDEVSAGSALALLDS